jgi:riboflavin synthase
VFSGIIEERGRFVGRDGSRHTFAASSVLEELAIGESVAVNGVGLTVIDVTSSGFSVQLSPETLSRTNLGQLAGGDPVNLELPVRMNERMQGHQVLGMIDAVGEIVDPAPNLRVRLPRPLLRYCVEKGAIAIDGVSLALSGIDGDCVLAAIIPRTTDITTLGVKGPGDLVNVEVDIMAKHLEKLLDMHHPGI